MFIFTNILILVSIIGFIGFTVANSHLPYETEAAQVVKELSRDVTDSTLLHHPFLKCYSTGGFIDMNIATYELALNDYALTRGFLKFLNGAKDKFAPEDAELFSGNMNEEMGIYEEDVLKMLEANGIRRAAVDKIPHSLLIRRFLNAVGIDQKESERADTLGAIFTQKFFESFEKSNACEALAVVGFVIEQTVAPLFQFFWAGLRDHTTMNPDDFVFFPLHILVDDGHADHFKEKFFELYAQDREQCKNAPALVRDLLARHAQMFTDLKARVEALVGGKVCEGTN